MSFNSIEVRGESLSSVNLIFFKSCDRKCMKKYLCPWQFDESSITKPMAMVKKYVYSADRICLKRKPIVFFWYIKWTLHPATKNRFEVPMLLRSNLFIWHLKWTVGCYFTKAFCILFGLGILLVGLLLKQSVTYLVCLACVCRMAYVSDEHAMRLFIVKDISTCQEKKTKKSIDRSVNETLQRHSW